MLRITNTNMAYSVYERCRADMKFNDEKILDAFNMLFLNEKNLNEEILKTLMLDLSFIKTFDVVCNGENECSSDWIHFEIIIYKDDYSLLRQKAYFKAQELKDYLKRKIYKKYMHNVEEKFKNNQFMIFNKALAANKFFYMFFTFKCEVKENPIFIML